MKQARAKKERLQRAKEQLAEIFEEVLLWLNEAREDTCHEQLFDYSLRAAELAAILGFAKPPFEHVAPVQLEPDGQIRYWQASVHPRTVRVNAPIGMSSFPFYPEEPLAGTLIRESNPRVYEELRSYVMKWMRALSRLDIREVKPAECVMAMYDESMEALIFQEQYERELRSDTRSYLQDALKNSFEGARLARLYNLSPEQNRQLGRAMGRSWADALRSNQPASAPQGRTTVKTGTGTPRLNVEAAEAKAAAIIASEGYPGLRKLAARLGCSHETVRKYPSVRRHLKPKRQPTCDPRDISEVNVADTSAADPLEQLIEQESLEKMLSSLGPEERSAFLEKTPQQQRELLAMWESQQRDEHEDARSKATTRRRVV